jgi:LacI family transcriptional regulator
VSASIVNSIAREVGVSPRTVRRVLNGEVRDTRPTFVRRAEKIRELGRRANYLPNAAARATRTGRFNVVTLLLSTVPGYSHLFGGLLVGIEEELARKGQQLHLTRLTDAALTDERFMPRALREWCSDGLLVNYQHHIPAELVRLIRQHRLPSVWMNSKQEKDCVYPDEHKAGLLATRWLLERGRRLIAYVDYSHGEADDPAKHYSERDRLGGYRQAMREAGLAPRRIGARDSAVASAEHLALSRRWLEAPDRPDGVVVYSDVVAIFAAAQSLGLRVGEELEIMAFAEGQVKVGGQPLPTTTFNAGELGRKSVRMLLEKIAHPDRLTPPCVIEPFIRAPDAEDAPARA